MSGIGTKGVARAERRQQLVHEAVEELALAALAEDWQAESWLTALAALAPSEAAETPGSSVRFWSDGSPFVAPGTLVFAALPAGADFRRLLVDSP